MSIKLNSLVWVRRSDGTVTLAEVKYIEDDDGIMGARAFVAWREMRLRRAANVTDQSSETFRADEVIRSKWVDIQTLIPVL